jgi:hypothetical protein
MVWKSLIGYVGRPISALPQAPVEIFEGIYQYGPAYLRTVPYIRDLTPSSEPIITLIVWAASKGALERALFMNLEADDQATGVPPQELLLSPNATTWATIIANGKAKGFSFMESAEYRIAKDGAFIQRKLQSRHYRAYFRSRHDQQDEQPYAIAVSA